MLKYERKQAYSSMIVQDCGENNARITTNAGGTSESCLLILGSRCRLAAGGTPAKTAESIVHAGVPSAAKRH